jgi:hypothetical protein
MGAVTWGLDLSTGSIPSIGLIFACSRLTPGSGSTEIKLGAAVGQTRPDADDGEF